MARDLTNLELRHGTWFARVTVPTKHRHAMGGKQKLFLSLKTRSLREAKEERASAIVALQAKIKECLGQSAASKSFAFGLKPLQMGQEFRKRIERAESEGSYAMAAAISIEAMDREVEFGAGPNGRFVGQTMWTVATGGIAINEHLERWLSEMSFKERTKADRRMSVRELLAWLVGRNIAGVVAAVDSKIAGDFRLQALEGMHPRTANKRLEALRAYWRWLASLGYAPDNPWIGKSISKRAVKDEAPERPFSDEEVSRLFAGGPTWQMRDVMAIAALSGARLDEIFQLKVVDCADQVFDVRTAKTHAGIRRVPIHPALTNILSRRIEGKSQGDYLLEEGTDSGWDGNRSMAFSKRFATYRRASGVDEVHKGNARSRVNFHSWRRWFITKADQQGHRREDIERTVGHKVQGMSLGLYSSGASIEQLRAVVESVKLPIGIVVDDEARPVIVVKPKVFLRRKPLAGQKVRLVQKHKA